MVSPVIIRLFSIIGVGAGILLWAAPVISSGQDLYVSNFGSNAIGEYDASTGAPVTGFTSPTVSQYPFGIAISGSDIYVVNGGDSGDGTIGEYNAATGAAVAGFTPISEPDNDNAAGIAVWGGNLYVTNNGISSYSISEYNATTGAQITSFNPSGVEEPSDVAASGGVVYVSDVQTGTVDEFDAATGESIRDVNVIGYTVHNDGIAGVLNVAVSGSDLYVSDYYDDKVSEYNAITGNAISGFVSPGGLTDPFGLAVSGGDLFVADTANNTVGEYNAATGAQITSFTSPSGLDSPSFIAVSPVPEPATWVLFVCGGGVLCGLRRFGRGG